MELVVCDSKQELGRRAAADAAVAIRAALQARGHANIILSTGASQFEVLDELVKAAKINWCCVTVFHLDEYVGMPMSHPASFRRYLKERFVERLPQMPAAVHYCDGEADPGAECRRLNDIILRHPIDVALIGIGENGHLAFNDPPADFETNEPFIVVEMDDACRRQQTGEGWFPRAENVPRQAISMSIRQILRSEVIICSTPDERKARAVRDAVQGPITPTVPASILQQHPRATIFLEPKSASLLNGHGV